MYLTRSILLALTSFSAYAGAVAPAPLPEPGTLELMAIAIVAGIIVAVRRQRRK